MQFSGFGCIFTLCCAKKIVTERTAIQGTQQDFADRSELLRSRKTEHISGWKALWLQAAPYCVPLGAWCSFFADFRSM